MHYLAAGRSAVALGTRVFGRGWGMNSFRRTFVTCNVVGMTVKHRVSEYRRRMRARGLRPVQIWVPDVRSERFALEAERQAALVARADEQSHDQEFVEAVTAPWDEE